MLVKIDIKIPVCLKKDVSVCIKFLLIIHAHLHLQKSIYLHFLHPQRNDLPKIIGFKINKQRKNSTQVTERRRIHFKFVKIT